MTKEDDFEVEFITAIIILLILIAVLIGGAVVIGKYHDDEKWNNGYCPACGSEWEYEQAVGHYSSTQYIYVCNKCGRRIEISDIR